MKIPIENVSRIKMVTNPSQEIIDTNYNVIHLGFIKHWVGIGWVTEHKATEEDYLTIPEIE